MAWTSTFTANDGYYLKNEACALATHMALRRWTSESGDAPLFYTLSDDRPDPYPTRSVDGTITRAPVAKGGDSVNPQGVLMDEAKERVGAPRDRFAESDRRTSNHCVVLDSILWQTA